MFSGQDIVDYYDSTYIHYKKWWRLTQAYALHYGIWDENTRNFSESLLNTNKVLMDFVHIKNGDKILDAGCGVGGSSFYLASKKDVEVTGISLSNKQVKEANLISEQKGLKNKVSFRTMDYTQTDFPDETFDIVWACESMCHAMDKARFLKESFRILNKGGKLILSDYFLTEKGVEDEKELIRKWRETWSINNFAQINEFQKLGEEAGFKNIGMEDYTAKITNTSKIYFYFSLLGSLPSILYNVTHPRVRRFAKTHYKSGYFQYLALRSKLWEYYVVLLEK